MVGRGEEEGVEGGERRLLVIHLVMALLHLPPHEGTLRPCHHLARNGKQPP